MLESSISTEKNNIEVPILGDQHPQSSIHVDPPSTSSYSPTLSVGGEYIPSEENFSQLPPEINSRLIAQLEKLLQVNTGLSQRITDLELAQVKSLEEHPIPMDDPNPLLEEIDNMKQENSRLLQKIYDLEEKQKQILESHAMSIKSFELQIFKLNEDLNRSPPPSSISPPLFVSHSSSVVDKTPPIVEEVVPSTTSALLPTPDSSIRLDSKTQNTNHKRKTRGRKKRNKNSSFSSPSSTSYHPSSIKVRSVWVRKDDLQCWRDLHPLQSYSLPTVVQQKYSISKKATPSSHSRHFNFVPPISNTSGLLGKPPTILKRVVQHHILQPISTSSHSSPYLHPHHPFRKHRSHLQKFPPSFKTYHLSSSNNGRLVWVRNEDFTEKDTPKHYTISSNGIGS